MNRAQRRQSKRLTEAIVGEVKDLRGRDVEQQTFTLLQTLNILSKQALDHAIAARQKTDAMKAASDSRERMMLMGDVQAHLVHGQEAGAQAMRMLVEGLCAVLDQPVRLQVHGGAGPIASGPAKTSIENCPVRHDLLNGVACPECGAIPA